MGGPHTPEALKAARCEAGKVVDTVCFDKGWGFRDALIEAIAPLIVLKDTALAALQQVTAERDAAIKTCEMTAMSGGFYARHAESAETRANRAKVAHDTATSELARLRAALEFYADPAVYEPHPHGPAFDCRDLSGTARAALARAATAREG